MLEVGSRVPDVRIWTAPRESAALAELGLPALYFFYLFDWSST